jgi:hypothetical protein
MLLAKLEQYDQKPATTSIPVQLSGPEFTAFIFPRFSMPMRARRCCALSRATRDNVPHDFGETVPAHQTRGFKRIKPPASLSSFSGQLSGCLSTMNRKTRTSHSRLSPGICFS